jgi:hypothetical protein
MKAIAPDRMPPGEHDPGDPAARAEAFQQEIRRHFEQEIAEEEDAGTQAIGSGRDVEVLTHGQGGKAHIGPVEIGNEVADDQKRDEPRGYLPHRALFHDVHTPCRDCIRRTIRHPARCFPSPFGIVPTKGTMPLRKMNSTGRPLAR